MDPALALPLFGPALPEIILAALALLAAAFLAVLGLPAERTEALAGSFVVDSFAKFMKCLTLIGAAAGIVMATDYLRREGIDRFEFPILIVLSTIGMLMVISANDLIALYLGLELLSLSSYVIAAFDRDNVRSTEAGLKYFVLGALSSGMLLYGASLVYGFTGSVSFPVIASVLQGQVGIGAIVGLVFVSAGIAFKISAVPFHMWTPDVYEGSPTPVTAFFAAAPKVAAMALLIRALVVPFAKITGDWQQIVVFISIASMLLGAFAAIGQHNIKRLLAYSSIGHMGYALVGLARTNKLMAFIMAMFMFSLAGIPPLAGFFAKYFVFLAAIEGGLVTLAVIGVISSVIGAYYYLRIV